MGGCISTSKRGDLSHGVNQQGSAGRVGKGGNTHIHHNIRPLSPRTAPDRRGQQSNGTRIHTVYITETGLRVFSFEELRQATRNFRPDSLLGEGGFGSVFRGWIDESEKGAGQVVAVKVLNTEGLQGHKEWMAEVDFLGLLHHENLVRLIGYCAEDEQRLLVYEYMPRGSLENHLFRRSLAVLPWATRIQIALGAARGLAYLHEEAERQVIYRDFKTSNILLDHDFNSKLSDFGLAKDGPEGDKTHVSTRVMGTYGYAAPEYVMTGHLTAKSDVYSYGVVLLEMITGRRSMDKSRPPEEHNLVDWARQFFADRRKLFRLMDPRLEGQYSVRGATKAALLAQHCLSRDPKSRPLMSDVVETLKPLQGLTDMAASYSDSAAGVQGARVASTVSSSPSRGERGTSQLNPRQRQPLSALSAKPSGRAARSEAVQAKASQSGATETQQTTNNATTQQTTNNTTDNT